MSIVTKWALMFAIAIASALLAVRYPALAWALGWAAAIAGGYILGYRSARDDDQGAPPDANNPAIKDLTNEVKALRYEMARARMSGERIEDIVDDGARKRGPIPHIPQPSTGR